MGIFAGRGQFKAAHHVHTTNSDGGDTLASVIEEHYARAYDILAITDHNFMTRHWVGAPNGPDPSRFDQIASGSDRGNRPMLMIPDSVEQTGPWDGSFVPRLAPDDVNTFMMDFLDPANIESYLGQLPNFNGVAHFNHTGRSVGAANVNNPTHINRYTDLFMRHARCVGLEIVNRKDAEPNDRIFWDNVNSMTIPQGRFVWGFSNDDAHSNVDTGFSFNVMVMPELSVDAFRDAMLSGSFYAVARVAQNEGVTNFNDRDSVTPVINDIEIAASHIAINASNYHRIDWITEGTETIAHGETLNISQWSGGVFVRANVVGWGGVAFTQPFAVEEAATGGIEFHTRMRLPVAPRGPDDIARRADLGATYSVTPPTHRYPGRLWAIPGSGELRVWTGIEWAPLGGGVWS